jgi:hypothetical protein
MNEVNDEARNAAGFVSSRPRAAEAGEGTRTLDPQLGKLMLYQLSYTRKVSI